MKRIIWGIILLVLGVLVLLQVLGVVNFGLAFWPVVLLLIGLTIIWESVSNRFISWFLLGLGLWVGGIGLFNILANAGVTQIAGGDIARYGWPIILVTVGLSILFGDRSWHTGSKHRHFRGHWIGQEGSWESCARMRHIGDLYHGRNPWVLEKNHEFYHGIGDVVIDLTTADIRPGNYLIYIKAGIGELTIRIPDGINVEIDASVGVGELDLFGEERSGIGGLSLHREIEHPNGEANVKIGARLGIGELTAIYLPTNPGVIK